jgi:tRNA U34 5-carboxymethylaminomethyl modifying GTPase MnmE/TrmE
MYSALKKPNSEIILKDLAEYVGETTNEDILNEIFNQFCIGK